MDEPTQNSPRQLEAPEVARIVRKHLKKLYPDTTFKVVSSSLGHGSIDILWSGPPSPSVVRPIVERYQGLETDSVDNLKARPGWLKNGLAVAGPEEGAEEVRFYVLYLTCERPKQSRRWG